MLETLQVCSNQCSFLDAAADRKGTAEPLFLLYRNGALKQQIEGANTPGLKSSIMELTPLSADADDLEVDSTKCNANTLPMGHSSLSPKVL